jgi:hypothetical protein
MSEGEIVVRVVNGKKNASLYIKAPFLEEMFKEKSEAEFDKARIRSVRTERMSDPLYELYLLRRLPSTPYPLTADGDIYNNFGFLRGKGLTEGLYIPVTFPISRDMAKDWINRITETIKYLYSLYADHFDMEVKLYVEKDDEETSDT